MTEHQNVLRLAAKLHARGARGADYRVALTLWPTHQGLRIPLQTLAELLDMPVARVQESVRRLVRFGLVGTARNPDHIGRGRSKVIWLDAGQYP